MRTSHHTAAGFLATIALQFCLVPLPTVSASPATSSAGTGLTILSPAGGEVFRVNDSMTIQWQLDSGTYISDAIVIEISADSGLTYALIGPSIKRTSNEFKTRRMRWLVPDSLFDEGRKEWVDLRTNGCMLYLHGYSNYALCDYSKKPFAIEPTAVCNGIQRNDRGGSANAAKVISPGPTRAIGNESWMKQNGRLVLFYPDGRLIRTMSSSQGRGPVSVSILTQISDEHVSLDH